MREGSAAKHAKKKNIDRPAEVEVSREQFSFEVLNLCFFPKRSNLKNTK